ncbi:DUF305 domain-containing protein [Clostridium polynesiense]|uniref:DUF305 domain-containing protein n=1 Tax=Clostridium polynesiense TaxID=1325933 RepID=UPI00058C7520|nr:DUF305 domain-containing protein [Clostridium polynesiense]
MKKYVKFGVMILTSTIIMYFLMFLNVYEFDHVLFSKTRLFMSIMMGAVMAVVMLAFMLKMYTNKKANAAIFALSILLFSGSLYMVRSQSTVNDADWMKAMIPHHSIALLTSERAELSDPRAKELAKEIIEAQEREIKEMKALIEELENK